MEEKVTQAAKAYADSKHPLCQETEQAFIDGANFYRELIRQLYLEDNIDDYFGNY